MQHTLIDPFELRAAIEPARPAYAARRSVEVEVDWDVEPVQDHDWQSSTTESSPGVSCESWHRARGWCAE